MDRPGARVDAPSRSGPGWRSALRIVFSVAGLLSGLILKGIGHLLDALGVSWADQVIAAAHVLLIVVAVVVVGRLLLTAASKRRRHDRARHAMDAALEPGGGRPADQRPERVVEALVRSGLFPGAALAVVELGDSRVRGFGRPRDGSEERPQSDSIFEIGSLTKVFTGVLLAEMVERGEVALDDRLERFLSGLGERARRITLLDLATHRSGLPRIPSGLMRSLLRDALLNKDPTTDPYAGLTENDLEAALRSARLRAQSAFRYSNFGFAVLGLALARAAGRSYEQLVEQRVCEPLGLRDTVFDPGKGSAERLVQGHKRDGSRAPGWHTAAMAPAAGLHSTAADMLRFAQAQLEPGRCSIEKALTLAQAPRRPTDKPDTRIGLGWLTKTAGGDETTWHNGGTGGCGAFVGIVRERSVAVVVLTNAAHDDLLDRSCFQVLEEADSSARATIA